jgi:hypothetical protein
MMRTMLNEIFVQLSNPTDIKTIPDTELQHNICIWNNILKNAPIWARPAVIIRSWTALNSELILDRELGYKMPFGVQIFPW